MPIVIIISIAVFLFIAGYSISARYYRQPLERLLIGLAIGACLCVVALGIFFAGCALVWRGI